MTKINKCFEIDVEGTTQENALFKGDEFICYADDVETIIEKLNELNNENDVLKQQLKTKYIVNKQYEEKVRLEKVNRQLIHDIKDALFVLACAKIDFKLSKNEYNAIKRLIKICDDDFFDIDSICANAVKESVEDAY